MSIFIASSETSIASSETSISSSKTSISSSITTSKTSVAASITTSATSSKASTRTPFELINCTLFWLTDIYSNLSSIDCFTSHGQSGISLTCTRKVNMTESSWVALLIFSHSHPRNWTVFSKGFLENRLFCLKAQISDEKSATVYSLGLLCTLLSFLSALSLFDVKPPSHVFGFVVCNRIFDSFIVM